MNIEGLIAVVTGGAGNLGQAIVQKLKANQQSSLIITW